MDKNEIIDCIFKLDLNRFNLSHFDIVLYFMVIIISMNKDSDYSKMVIDYLERNHFIYNPEIRDYDFYDRFETADEGLRWIIAYKSTQIYFLNNLMAYDQTENFKST